MNDKEIIKQQREDIAKLENYASNLDAQVKDYKSKLGKLQTEQATVKGQYIAYKDHVGSAKPDFTSQVLLKPFSGQDSTYSVKDFLSQFERVARAAKWGPDGILLVAENKLVGAAKAALHANTAIAESQEPLVLIREVLEERFPDRQPNYYLRELSGAQQKTDESVLAFGDRVTELGYRAIPSSTSHSAEEGRWTDSHRDALTLAAYLNGLKGEPGLQLNYHPPETMAAARQNAATIERVHKDRDWTIVKSKIGKSKSQTLNREKIYPVTNNPGFQGGAEPPRYYPSSGYTSNKYDPKKWGETPRYGWRTNCRTLKNLSSEGSHRPKLNPSVSPFTYDSSKMIWVDLTVNRTKVRLLCDTGAAVSVLNRPVPGSKIVKIDDYASGVTGNSLHLTGEQWVKINVGSGQTVSHKFFIGETYGCEDGILGLDALQRLGATIFTTQHRVNISPKSRPRNKEDRWIPSTQAVKSMRRGSRQNRQNPPITPKRFDNYQSYLNKTQADHYVKRYENTNPAQYRNKGSYPRNQMVRTPNNSDKRCDCRYTKMNPDKVPTWGRNQARKGSDNKLQNKNKDNVRQFPNKNIEIKQSSKSNKKSAQKTESTKEKVNNTGYKNNIKRKEEPILGEGNEVIRDRKYRSPRKGKEIGIQVSGDVTDPGVHHREMNTTHKPLPLTSPTQIPLTQGLYASTSDTRSNEREGRDRNPRLLIARVAGPFRIPPLSETLVRIRHPRYLTSNQYLFEPSDPQINGVRFAKSVHTTSNSKPLYVRVINANQFGVDLQKHTPVGQLEEDFEILDKIDPYMDSVLSNDEIDQKLYEKTSHLQHKDQGDLLKVLKKYRNILNGKLDQRGCIFPMEHEINTEDVSPIKQRPYKVPFALRSEMESQVQELLKNGIIRESKSAWRSPVILVKKKSINGETSYRFCTDFRKLNAVTKIPNYPIPIISDILDQLGQMTIFSKIDLKSGYHQIGIREQDKHKSAFQTPQGLYEYNKLGFGLGGAPATFQSIMDHILVGLIGVDCLIYLDDIVVYSHSMELHCEKLDRILKRFQEVNLKINLEKTEFAKSQITFLGNIISAEGIRPETSTVEKVLKYPKPKNVKDVRAFIGLSGFYRRYINQFSEIAKPLTELTKKHAKFVWTEKENQAFNILKEALCSEPILKLPLFDREFTLTTDASSFALGAILSQIDDKGEGHPIAYASRLLNTAEMNYSALERELLGIVWAIKHFRCYLYGRKFKLLTDAAALIWITKQNEPSPRVARWIIFLQEYMFEIKHAPGKSISHVDALSRINAILPEWSRAKVALAQSEDANLQKFILKNQTSCISDQDGLVFLRGETPKILVPKVLVPKVLYYSHDIPLAGHPGVDRTKALISQNYYWPGLDNSVREYIKTCVPCGRRKTPPVLKRRLGTANTAEYVGQYVYIDIVGPLPVTARGNKYYLSSIDAFSRYVELCPLQDYTAKTVAEACVANIFARFGCPVHLSSDQGSSFTSEIFQQICKILRINKIQTTAYHPQANIVERIHRNVHDSMSHFVRSSGRDWDKVLPLIQGAINSIAHTSTKFSPNYLMFGREIRPVFEVDLTFRSENDLPSTPLDEAVVSLKEKLETTHAIAWENSNKSHMKNQYYYDRGATPHQYKINDSVYLKQMTKPAGVAKKFFKPWSGPYKIIRKISDWVFEIQLGPEHTLITNIDRLKPMYPREKESMPNNPEIQKDPDVENEIWADALENFPEDMQSSPGSTFETFQNMIPQFEPLPRVILEDSQSVQPELLEDSQVTEPSDTLGANDLSETFEDSLHDDQVTICDPDSSWVPDPDDTLIPIVRSPYSLRPRK